MTSSDLAPAVGLDTSGGQLREALQGLAARDEERLALEVYVPVPESS